MNEALLQFIWQWSLYRPDGLTLTTGEVVTVQQPGLLNRDSGPDFLNARIRVGGAVMAGHVEMHLRSSDWLQHGHQRDAAYGNVVLHVVLRHDAKEWPSGIPVLELEKHIPGGVIKLYKDLVLPPRALPCAPYLAQVSAITKESQLARMLAERWEGRRAMWEQDLETARGDWHALLFQRICAGLGSKVNSDAFVELARLLPLSILQRHHQRAHDLEALLFGAAGFLDRENDEEDDAYTAGLRESWVFLKAKYSLTSMPIHRWKFLRMRPANFPTVRIAQLAALLHALEGDIAALLSLQTGLGLREKLAVAASEYWHTHYRLNAAAGKASPKNLGATMAALLVINTIAPVQYLSRRAQGDAAGADKARDLLEEVSPEDNTIVSAFADAGWKPLHAGHTQAMIQLFRHYCEPRRCLECSVGLSILKRRPVE